MGAMARQVPQVKRKNSTSCSPPESSLTVDGSVACSSGPREVAIGMAVAARASVGPAVSWAGIYVAGGAVGLGSTTSGWAGATVDVPAAHAARKTVSRTRLSAERSRNIVIELLICIVLLSV